MLHSATLVLALAGSISSAQQAVSRPEVGRPQLLWEDLDADGRPDLVALHPERDDVLLKNLGGGRFTDETDRAGLGGLRSRSVLIEDLDGDGGLDLFSVGRDGAPRLFRNVGDGASLALAGRVPVKVTAANGPIEPGDLLTLSAVPGHATKATEAGVVIGTALLPWRAGEGKILAFVRTGWYAPDPDAGRMGELQRELDDLRVRLSRLEGERSPR